MLSHHPLQMLMPEATNLLDAKKLQKRLTATLDDTVQAQAKPSILRTHESALDATIVTTPENVTVLAVKKRLAIAVTGLDPVIDL